MHEIFEMLVGGCDGEFLWKPGNYILIFLGNYITTFHGNYILQISMETIIIFKFLCGYF